MEFGVDGLDEADEVFERTDTVEPHDLRLFSHGCWLKSILRPVVDIAANVFDNRLEHVEAIILCCCCCCC